MEETTYKEFKKCYRLTNGVVDLVVTASVGPRIIRYGFVDGQNLFGEVPDVSVEVGKDQWHIYGGHRLWHSPEANPRTYAPDNSPVTTEVRGNTLHLIQATEPTTGIRKEMEVTLFEENNHVRVIHRLTNQGLWPVKLSVWALSVMNVEGTAIVPQPQGDRESLLPNWRMTIWPYTSLADPRVAWGSKFITLKQDPRNAARFKIGLSDREGWVGYVLKDQLFIKRFRHEEGAEYPDWGCSLEVFTNDRILEVESLSPLTTLDPGGEVEHTEDWYLFDQVKVTAEESSIEQNVVPLVRSVSR